MLAEIEKDLRAAYEAGLPSIVADGTGALVPAESFSAIAKVEEHRWYWRPERPRLLLIAESHVYTSDADVGIKLDPAKIRPCLPGGRPLPPEEYVGLVYCLGYGENGLLSSRHCGFRSRSTWQFWDLLGRIAETGKQPRAGESSLAHRLRWKVGTLERLKELGVWLLDASAHAIYLGGGLRRSPEACQAFHREWWRHYGRGVVAGCRDPVVWVIGASAHRNLHGLDGFQSRGFIYQPRARGGIDKEHGWDRLLADVAKLRADRRLGPWGFPGATPSS